MAREQKPFKKPEKLKDMINNNKVGAIAAKIEKQGEEAIGEIQLTQDIEDNYLKIQEIFKDCFDIVLRRFTIGEKQAKCFLAYIDGIVNKDEINNYVLNPLMTYIRATELEKEIKESDLVTLLTDTSISDAEVKEVKTIKDAVKEILSANTVLFIDKNPQALRIGTTNWPTRGISEPITEAVVRGPMEGFVENLKVNTVLLRKRLKTPKLKMESMQIGRLSKTNVVIAYIKGIAKEKIINELKKRLNRIDIDVLTDSGYLQHFIEDTPLSPFPQLYLSERPDTTAASLAEGRIAVIVDGSPFVITLPVVFASFMNASEDYYDRFYFASFIRIIRYISISIALLGPSIYIALTTFHQEMIPKPLLITIAASRAQVPYPAIVEALLMEISFEILREAGVRLPKPVGQAVSIVGALIIGQAAVQAGFVSQAMVIVVAITGIASFTMPQFSTAISLRLLRFPIMFLAATFGVFGIVVGVLFILIHMISLRSFGIPYLSPFSPLALSDWKDTFVRLPVWTMQKRPIATEPEEQVRMGDNITPVNPDQGDKNE